MFNTYQVVQYHQMVCHSAIEITKEKTGNESHAYSKQCIKVVFVCIWH
jgi:hypothetical protein